MDIKMVDIISSIKSEPDVITTFDEPHKLHSVNTTRESNQFDTDCHSFDLKLQVKSETDTDENISSELAEGTEDLYQDITVIKIETDDSEEQPISTQDLSDVTLASPKREDLQKDSFPGEVLEEAEPMLPSQEGRVNHIMNYQRKFTSMGGDVVGTQPQSGLPRKYECTKKNLISGPTLASHIKPHNGRCLSCPTCGKLFRKKEYLTSHSLVHSAEKPYTCDLCGKTFSRSDSLAEHMSVHTGITRKKKVLPKKHTCDECGRSFSKPSLLQYHQNRHSEKRPFTCDQCSASFKVFYDLKDHQQRVHPNEKVHVCEDCGHHFSRLYCLKKHQRIHTGEKPYSCAKCPKTYRYKYSLACHMKCHVD